MRKQYKVSEIYPVSIEMLWRDILDPTALADSMKGAISYSGLPSEPVVQGQVIDVIIKRWGWLPLGRWRMEVVRRDDENFILESREGGGFVRDYKHRLELHAIDTVSTRYTDYLDIDAGWLTPLIAPTFKKIYVQRHTMRRNRLLQSN